MPDHNVTELSGYFRALQGLVGDEIARIFIDQATILNSVEDTLQRYCSDGSDDEDSFNFDYKGKSEIEYADASRLLDEFLFEKLRQIIDSTTVDKLKNILISYLEMVGITMGRTVPYDLNTQSSFYLLDADVKGLERSLHIAIKYKNELVIINIGYF